MTRALVLLLALVAIAAQRPPDESNLPESEKRIPAGDYCKHVGVTIGPREVHAHSCDCKYSCSINPDGTVSEHEDAKCLAFCHANGRRCTCHPEEPCDVQGGLVDMDGQVIAVARRPR